MKRKGCIVQHVIPFDLTGTVPLLIKCCFFYPDKFYRNENEKS